MRTVCPNGNPPSKDRLALRLRTDCPKTWGMTEISSFRSVIELWPSREAAAAAIGANSWTVSKWWQRKSIPAEWWEAVLATDAVREAGVTAETLTGFAAREVVEGDTEEARV